jgi:chemotaxis protein methyltransferase CheR
MSALAPVPVSALAPQSLDDEEFAHFQALIRDKAGIFLAAGKKALLVARLLRRVRELGLGSFSDYYTRVTRQDPGELTHLLDLITTNETRFFRDPAQFAFLADQVCPRWRAASSPPRTIRVWSAGCASGEEPYSAAMVLRQALPASDGWGIDLLATDLSTRVLQRAQRGFYPVSRAAEIPERYRRAYMLKGVRSQEGAMRVCGEIASLVRFQRLNLCADVYPRDAGFDLIFCRNVLIYFEAAVKAQVIGRLRDCLAPGGLLFVGMAETVVGVNRGLRPVGPMTYATT